MSDNNIYDIVPELTENSEKTPKKKKLSKKAKKAVLWSSVAAVSALVIAVGIIFGIPYYEKLTRPEYSIANMPMIYTTEAPELFVYDQKIGQSDVLSSLLLDKNTSSPYVISDISVDGNSFYFIDSLGDLYRSNLDLGTENVFIAENATGFMTDIKGNLVFLTNDGSLNYCKFNKDRVTYTTSLVDSNVSSFKYSSEGKKVIYVKALENKSNLFYAKLGSKIKTHFLYEDCGEFLSESKDDLSLVYTMKISESGKRTVLKTTSLRKTEVAVSEADIIYSIGEDGSIVYGMSTGNGVDFDAYFSDSNKNTDAEIEEPVFSDYLYGNISFDEFSAQQEKWDAKVNREEIRDMLVDMTEVNNNYDLYKYSNGASVLIDKNVSTVLDKNDDNSSIIYTVSSIKLPESETICDIADFASVEDALLKVTEILSNGDYTHKLYMDDIDVARTLYSYRIGGNDEFLVNPEFTGLYVYTENEEAENGKVVYIDFALGNVGTPVTVTEAALEAPVITGDRVVVNEQISEGETTGSLLFYANSGKRNDIGKNIQVDSVLENESGSTLYITNNGELIFKTTEEKVLAEDVVGYYYRTDGCIYYVCKSDANGYVLFHYNGEVSKGVATNILSVMPF